MADRLGACGRSASTEEFAPKPAQGEQAPSEDQPAPGHRGQAPERQEAEANEREGECDDNASNWVRLQGTERRATGDARLGAGGIHVRPQGGANLTLSGNCRKSSRNAQPVVRHARRVVGLAGQRAVAQGLTEEDR